VNPGRARGRRARAAFVDLAVGMGLTMASHDVFHAILELELLFLEGDFFNLFGFGEVMLGGKFVQAIFELVMLVREGVEFLVGAQQLSLESEWLYVHGPPP
jgi:hypothetical protein